MPKPSPHPRRASFEAIGTLWEIQTLEVVSATGWKALLERIYARIEAFDKAYSRFRPDSFVSHMSRKAGTYDLPSDAYPLVRFYEKLYQLTGGLVTPLIGNLMEAAGYDASYSLKGKALWRPPRWEDVISYDKTSITLARPALLDFGAAGKGYLVDILAGLVDEAGIRSYSINAGGDIVHRSRQQEPLTVGLENPLDTSEAIGVIKLTNKSLCASGGNKRAWDKYHHILNPRLLQSPHDILATWVIANDTMTADGLATALFFVGASTLAKGFAFSYAVLAPDMQLEYSPNFPATMFEAGQ